VIDAVAAAGEVAREVSAAVEARLGALPTGAP